MAEVLDQIEVAMCLFDADDRTVQWNDCFERFDSEDRVLWGNGQFRRLSERLEKLAVTDSPTGLANRRRFDENLATEWRRRARGTAPLSLRMIDVDRFKAINDAHGHAAGDTVLRRVADCLAAAVRRAGDLVARYGGEEFAMLLPRTGHEAAHAMAQAIRLAIAALPLDADGAARVTVRIGISTTDGVSENEASTSLLERADAALYAAKRRGRNRVVAAQEPGGVAALLTAGRRAG